MPNSSPDADLENLYRCANDGDPHAQRELAMRLQNGDGVPQDRSAAGIWLKKAAEGGDPWAQIHYALALRSTKEPENERESVEWLKRAVQQCDPMAHFTLGLQQFLGIGTPIDVESALVSFIMASLGGFEDARKPLADLAESRNIDWNAVFDRVQWAKLTFIMGPFLDGHLEGLTTYRQHKDGSDDTLWWRYETENAQSFRTLLGSILDKVFDYPVSVRDVYVGRAIVDDQTLAAITISMRDITDSNGNPVCFKPERQALDAVVPLLSLLHAREWVRWSYMSF